MAMSTAEFEDFMARQRAVDHAAERAFWRNLEGEREARRLGFLAADADKRWIPSALRMVNKQLRSNFDLLRAQEVDSLDYYDDFYSLQPGVDVDLCLDRERIKRQIYSVRRSR